VHRLPEKFDEGSRILVADPMLATGKMYLNKISVVMLMTSRSKGYC
jgi:uracil phosphoribosyltransferase